MIGSKLVMPSERMGSGSNENGARRALRLESTCENSDQQRKAPSLPVIADSVWLQQALFGGALTPDRDRAGDSHRRPHPRSPRC